MQNKLFAIMITALLVMLMAGSAMCATTNGCEESYYIKGDVDFDGTFTAGDMLNITVWVCLHDCGHDCTSGCNPDFDNVTVTFNASNFGVDEITLELNETDGRCAEYIGNVTITLAEYEYTEVIVTYLGAINDSDEIRFPIEPGNCAYLDIKNYDRGYDGSDPDTKALTQLWWCYDYSYDWYQNGGYELYCMEYAAYEYDEYGNLLTINDRIERCDCFTATVDSPATLVYYETYRWPYNRIYVYNEEAAAEVTLRVHCVGNEDVEDAELTISFLHPISSLNLTSDSSSLYVDECYNVTAQIIDAYGDPIPMPGVNVRLFVNSGCCGLDETDDNGTVTFIDICEGIDEIGNITIRAQAECREGSMTIDIVEQVLDYVEIDNPECPMEFGADQDFTCTCYTNHDTEMCCGDRVWNCTLGTITEDGIFTAGDVEGVAEIKVNVSGVIGTAEIVINGIDCEDIGATPTQGIDQTIYSGTVSASWNFTGTGSVCIQALGDPIPEWDNGTKGALVFVESDDNNDTVTLDLNGTGDTWMQNKTTGNWSFYAAGDTSEVGLGIQQMFALVYDEPAPDPDPDPTPTATTSRSSRGGGGGGTYPPDPVPTPTPNATTTSEDPKPAATKTADAKPTVNLPGGDTTLDTTPDEEDDAPAGTDPTNAILLVLALLAVCVIGYVIYRRSQN